MKYFKHPSFIENKIYKNIYNKKNKKFFFCLSMFPYPSGKLHLGHLKNYILSDIISRFKYLKKHNIIHPIGWDAFGLPAENAANKFNLNPEKWTIANIKFMKKQIKFFSIFYNKKTEFATCDIKFYKWEFYIFILLIKNNLLYKKKKIINWDLTENTILSNEQVKNNKGWRSNEDVEKKNYKTWFINMKLYSNRLFNNLKYNNWSNKVKNIQKKWINIFLCLIINIKYLFINYNLKYINIKKIFLKNKKIYFILVKFKLKKIIFKKNFFYNKKTFFLTNFYLKKKKKIKNINYYIKKKKIFLIKFSNLESWAILRNRNWGTGFFFKKNKNKNYKNFKTLDTFFESSWYYLYYLRSKNITNKKKNIYFPINVYIGGIEHANLHLIYLRLINNIFYDLKIFNYKEIIKNFIFHGFINNKCYYKIINNKIEYFKNNNNCILKISKMSKSKKNGINPIKIIKRWGSDLLRLFFITEKPIGKNINWENKNLNFLKNFILKLNNLSIVKSNNINYIKNINIKNIHKIISYINKIIKVPISKLQKNIILFYLFPIIPNICKIFWYKNNNNLLIEEFNIKYIVKKKFNLFYKNKFIKKTENKLENFKNKKYIIKFINFSIDNKSIIII